MRAMQAYTAIDADEIPEGTLVYAFNIAGDLEYIISDILNGLTKKDIIRPYMLGRIETIRMDIEDKRFQINGVAYRFAMIAEDINE